ncbi:hypothetical protein HYH02_009630 [Chlamydomonas schloesseri]|uniref:Uncharacterized protein n=1 Tax=Chlamydomonas schloesseri TaxID=2026947 RepID=A0A835TEB8_9CHLO|nr:hypothetical protein HYH02_009630 [Chlamydomonas schloesseri]|eukprot:KAG2442142.1 hypothetical protein HYH02_009630 [Chlamydomonas schloesseri]
MVAMSLGVPERWLAAASGAGSASRACSRQPIASVTASRGATAFAQRRIAGVPAGAASTGPVNPGRCVPTTGRAGTSRLAAAASAGSASVSDATPERLRKVLEGLDELNSKDPRSVEVEGQQVPYELAYARWLTGWVLRLAADAGISQPSEELRIVARGQHVERWKVPRSSYPEGRTAYLQWREDLKKAHAATTTRLMAAAGYPEEACKRVEKLILKKALKETEGQIVEDALCLVFLERQFAEFFPKLVEQAAAAAGGGDPAAAQAEADAKMVDILQKSWKKMGPLGRAAAGKLPLGEREAALVGRALAG